MIGIAAIMRDCTAEFEEKRALRKEVATLRASGGSVRRLGEDPP
jgi:hypothetical protein